MSKILVKQAAPQIAPTIGTGGSGISFLLGGGKMKTPKQLEEAGFGKIGSPSHDFAMDNQRRGHMLRYGLAGLGAFNAAYNQTSSGQPGVIGAAGQGAVSGYYGSQGLEDFAARAGRRFGGKNLSGKVPDNTTQPTLPALAAPTQKKPLLLPENAGRPGFDYPTDVEFTEVEHDDEQGMLAEPTANLTTSKVGVRNPYSAMTDEYGRPRNPYDAMGREYGQ